MQPEAFQLARDIAPALYTPADSNFHPGLSLQELLHDLQHNTGFAILPPELLRFLGQNGTRSLLKRYGYDLGQRDAHNTLAQLPSGKNVDTVSFVVQALRQYLTASQVITNYTATDHATEALLEWTCILNFAPQLNLEQRVNHENITLWLLTGYVSGYLHLCFRRHCSLSYAKSFTGPTILYHFRAQTVQGIDEIDEDLFPAGWQQYLASTHSASKSALPSPLTTQPKSIPAGQRWMQDKSELVQTLRLVAPTDASVLLLGESGVGKSLVAREIHAISLRAQQPWIEINCAALPEQLIESELFGVERGAFSGAVQSRKGKFEQAHGGTLFLDEVALLSPSAQSKLLRVLQSGEFEKLGSNLTITCDVRIIAATNEPLLELVRQGKFREDLYYRMNVFPVHIPPLRERRNELPQLVAHTIKNFAKKYKKNIYRCTPQAREAILAYDWPGNIRELQNVLERAVIICPDATEIHISHLGRLGDGDRAMSIPTALTPPHPTVEFGGHVSSLETKAAQPPSATSETFNLDALADQLLENGHRDMSSIKDALARAAMRHSQGNISHAATMLGMTRGQLSYQLKKMQEKAEDVSILF